MTPFAGGTIYQSQFKYIPLKWLQCPTDSPVTCLSFYHSIVISFTVNLTAIDSSEMLVHCAPLKL